ncbi:MAG: NlpC/P60 family protein [Chitinophagaceae bacterium]|uniref:NlpC/P60 domain-containing protein n=1 Tax=Rurimicrobium arvi TaxID=2049916 RepID=A0ABP8MWH2_9BACT
MKKTLLSTLLVTILAVVGTSCNSAHELMEPKSLVLAKPRLENLNSVEAGSVATGKKAPGERNFVTSLNKFLNIKYANMLGVLPQVLTNDLLYDFIDEWYGTRYRLGGTDKRGIDCSAFVQRLYERVFNISLLRTAAEQFHLCQSIWDKEELREGDLVFFNIHNKRISHVGIYLINDYFVHSCTSSGVMISRLTDAYWRRYYAGAGRIPKKLALTDKDAPRF